MANILEIRDLTVSYASNDAVHKALDHISFSIPDNESIGIVGESGSGKTTLGTSILKLLSSNAGYDAGEIIFNNKNLLTLNEKALRKIRGKDISIVFQDPLASLDPLFTIGYQVAETIKAHDSGIEKHDIEHKIISQLKDVGLPEPEKLIHQYPHMLSGGMRQRVTIAIALVNHPRILIADEPTTALDVTIQAQIIDLLKEAKKRYNLALVLITHDLGITTELVDRLIVMYGGVIVEQGRADSVLTKPMHPYTHALLQAVPDMNDVSKKRLEAIPGMVRAHYDDYTGCRFYERCAYRTNECLEREPGIDEYPDGNNVRCIHPIITGQRKA